MVSMNSLTFYEGTVVSIKVEKRIRRTKKKRRKSVKLQVALYFRP